MKRRSGFGWLELAIGIILIALGVLAFAKPDLALTSLVFAYGVAAVVRDPAYHAVTGPLCGDFARIQRLVERLNAEQLPLAEFEERYLNGSLLEWLNRR